MIHTPSTSLQDRKALETPPSDRTATIAAPPPPPPAIVEPPPAPAPAPRLKGTLGVVTALLRRTGVPMTVRQIVEQAGAELPTRSRTPMTVVARDLAMDIKNKGEASAFVRTAPGRYTLRELVGRDPVTYS